MSRRRKDYSIPNCPKIGRYDGLGMAAVPLAIADKERELGISHGSNNNSSDYSWNPTNVKKIYTEKLNSLEEDLHKRFQAGYDAGYKKGYKDAKDQTLHELSKYSNEEIRNMIDNNDYHLWFEYHTK